jgi:hypothetical protein
MKKIVNGVRFDTEKAIEIGSESYGYGGDFRQWEATLYVTPKSRRYFLAGSGGPMSRFAQSAGQNEWTGGSDLIPMSQSEALEWAEQNLQSEDFEDHFADVIEDA